MEPEIFFSIVVPTYNRAHLIKQTLESAFQQTYSNYEVIVVDDGSTDNTIEILKNISNTRLRFIHTPNAERSAARNRGIELAKGQYVCFLDSDDLLLPNHLEVGYIEIIKRGFPSAIHLNFEVRDIDGHLLRKGRHFRSDYIQKKKLLSGNPFSCNGMFIKKSTALNIKFNEDRNLTNAEDYLLWLEIASRYPIYTVNTVTSVLVSHSGRSVKDNSISSLNLRKQLLMKYAFNDKEIKRFLGQYEHVIESYSDTYTAIHLIESGDLKNGIKHFLKGVTTYFPCILDRRTLGILKHTSIHLTRKLLMK